MPLPPLAPASTSIGRSRPHRPSLLRFSRAHTGSALLFQRQTLSKLPLTLEHLRKWKIGPAVKRVAGRAPLESKQTPAFCWASCLPGVLTNLLLVVFAPASCFCSRLDLLGTRKVAEKLVDDWMKLQAGGAKAAEAKPDSKDVKRKAELADGEHTKTDLIL